MQHLQIAERGVAGAEIVDRNAAAQIAQLRHELGVLLEMMQRRGFGEFDIEARRDILVGADVVDEAVEPGGIAGRGTRDVDAQMDARIGAQGFDRDLQRAAVDQADDAQLFGRGHELAGGRDGAVLAPHAQQALIFEDAAVMGVDDRLIGEHQPSVMQRGDDVVGYRHHAQAGAFALRRFLVDEEAVAAGAAGAFEGLFGAQHRFLA